MLDALELKRRRANPSDSQVIFEAPHRAAVNCSTGTGKTEAMIAGIAELLRTNGTTRVVIAVPTHKLGQGLAERINTAYGSEVAAEWYGMDQPDPIAPAETMCRLAEAAKELVSSGGEVKLLCSQRTKRMEYCPYHPRVAGANGCGYLRQQQSQVRARTRVWIVPSVMLATAPPHALKAPESWIGRRFRSARDR
jgi:Type III restriction enzyme, res subunit